MVAGLGGDFLTEGTVGLARAFMARGARAVVVSLWRVSDEATEYLMERFYAHLVSDGDQPPVAEALRRAENEARQVPQFRQPRFWAAFQAFGDVN